MCRRVAILLIMVSCGATAQEASDLRFSGYYKNLLISSDTIIPPVQPFVLDLNRLRIEVKGNMAQSTSFDVQYDNEAYLGNYLQTAQFQAQRELGTGQYWRLDSDYLNTPDMFSRHDLYRAYVTWEQGNTDVRFGRQRIAWGTGRFFSPLDLFNPIPPNTVERDERTGVDALLVERKLGPVGQLTAVYAPQRNGASDTNAIRWHGNVAGIDWSVVGGRFAGRSLVGVDIETQLGGAGLRAELSRTALKDAPGYSRDVVGVDYAFANTAIVTAELYYNGAGAARTSEYDFPSLFAGRIQNLARHYAGVYGSYDITPLLKSVNYFVANLDDKSKMFSPTLTYSVLSNQEWTLGIQRYAGSLQSEFGRFRLLVFTQFQYFF